MKRIIPALLLKNDELVKTINFKNEKYLGDVINTIKLFNDKNADELVILDKLATKKKYINFELLKQISVEAFMPLAYGGGISNIEDAKKIISLGYEKIIINSSFLKNPNLVKQISQVIGSQSLVVCFDVKKNAFGNYMIYNHSKKKNTNFDLVEMIKMAANYGAGEILINNVSKDGTYTGFDLTLVKMINSITKTPIIHLGGAGKLSDFDHALNAGADAVAAGSIFVFHGIHKAVLITYPNEDEFNRN